MDDLKQREGEELPAYSFVVERGKIKEFVQAVGDPNPVYVDKEHAVREGYADVIAPPTFGICVDLWGGADFIKLCEMFGLNPFKVLHGEQEYEYYGEIHPGDEITACPRLARVLSKEGKSGGIRMITLETTYFNQRGEKVLLSRCLIVERR